MTLGPTSVEFLHDADTVTVTALPDRPTATADIRTPSGSATTADATERPYAQAGAGASTNSGSPVGGA